MSLFWCSIVDLIENIVINNTDTEENMLAGLKQFCISCKLVLVTCDNSDNY